MLSGHRGFVFDVREGQLQGRLNRWMGHYVLHPPLPSVGVVTARKGFASPLRALDWLSLDSKAVLSPLDLAVVACSYKTSCAMGLLRANFRICLR